MSPEQAAVIIVDAIDTAVRRRVTDPQWQVAMREAMGETLGPTLVGEWIESGFVTLDDDDEDAAPADDPRPVRACRPSPDMDGERAKSLATEAVLATEDAVDMWDHRSQAVIPEVLLMSGVILPDTRRVPLLNSHSKESVHHILGSVVDVRVKGSKLVGRLDISESEPALKVKVREGHVRNLSVGYRRLERTYVGDGATRTIEGKTFTGPVVIATKWELYEVSILAFGADKNAYVGAAA